MLYIVSLFHLFFQHILKKSFQYKSNHIVAKCQISWCIIIVSLQMFLNSPPSSKSHHTSTVPFPCFCWNCWLASNSRWSATFRGSVGLFLSGRHKHTLRLQIKTDKNNILNEMIRLIHKQAEEGKETEANSSVGERSNPAGRHQVLEHRQEVTSLELKH